MEELSVFELNKFQNIRNILKKYDDTEFLERQYIGYGIQNIPDDFTGQRIKNGDYKECCFNGNSFKYAGASGTRFRVCTLNDCIIQGTNMQFCDFSNSCIQSDKHTEAMIDASNLNQSSFYNTELRGLHIENSSISQSQFLKTKIYNCNFTHTTLQDNNFRDAMIQNSSFIGCNMEFSILHNTILKNVILPFHQIAYIFNGLQSILLPENNVKITSSMKNAPVLSVEEYLKLLPIFSQYYLEEREYFPLANIALFQKEQNLAKKYIYEGLKEYIRQRDFRKLKSLCRLAVIQGDFDRHFLSELYFRIVHYFMSIELTIGEQYQFNLHIDEIKNILFDSTEKSHIVLALKTDLTIEKSEEFICLISMLEDCLQYNEISDKDYSFEIKHNSPTFSIWIMAASIDQNQLILFVSTLYSIITGNVDWFFSALAVTADVITLGTFIKQLMANTNVLPPDSSVEAKDNKATSYISEKHKMLQERNIKLDLSIGNLHLNYESKKKCH
ncbi:pentapeptide repeat-containing protein [Lachnospiraceae bacterium 46-15]